HRYARPRAADGRASAELAPRPVLRVVETNRNLQAPHRPVDRVKGAPDLGDIRRTRAQEKLSPAPTQRSTGLDERLQHRQHLLDRAVPKWNDLQGVLS
ncbi:MAG TPA: hypothetical protein VFO02_12215, partial [Burkholderiales bacterium]|nr:hypothetical protein [Burkholderiales bacterium]